MTTPLLESIGTEFQEALVLVNNDTMSQKWLKSKIALPAKDWEKLEQWDKTVVIENLELLDSTVIDKACCMLLFDSCVLF